MQPTSFTTAKYKRLCIIILVSVLACILIRSMVISVIENLTEKQLSIVAIDAELGKLVWSSAVPRRADGPSWFNDLKLLNEDETEIHPLSQP